MQDYRIHIFALVLLAATCGDNVDCERGLQAFKCAQTGHLALRCGFCEAQLKSASQTCNGIQTRCMY